MRWWEKKVSSASSLSVEWGLSLMSASRATRLRAIAGPTVQFLGQLDDDALRAEYRRAQAVVLPAEEDFGIVPVEALATGRPVVAFAEGGAPESIRDGEGGVLFAEATPASLAAALDRLEQRVFEPARLRALARRFDREEFERRFAAWIDDARRARDARPA